MARGPDGQGGGAGTSLADQLFNTHSVADLAAEFAVLPGFDAQAFHAQAMTALHDRPLLARLDWLADCLTPWLPRDFPAMADALETAMPPPLDPWQTDSDFGRFIHAVHGVLAVRHGMDDPDRALDLIHAATRRFSMEYALRPFLNRWPDLVLARLTVWARDDNYHVRRLVSEGTRPRLPWGQGLSLDPLAPLPLLDALQADPTRFVTRSVANHLNDLSRTHPDAVLDRLTRWRAMAGQTGRERDWMARHALRGAVKRGHRDALAFLGYGAGAVTAELQILTPQVAMGDALCFGVTLTAPAPQPVMVDYRIRFARPGRAGEKVFKLKSGKVGPDAPLRLQKRHVLKGNATTFRLYPGRHEVTVQVNGIDVAEGAFDLSPRNPSG